MNLYFLLEDSKSFFYVFPKWMKIILPQFSEINALAKFCNNDKCFLIESGFGYPSIKNYFEQSLCTIVENNIPLDYFIICWDTDARANDEVELDLSDFKNIFSKYPSSFELRLLVINRCFETWLLGNRQVYLSSCTKEKMLPFIEFYNVGKYDPEKMYAPVDESIANYHYKYLQEMLRNSCPKKNYSKGRPLAVSTKEYYEELYSRISDTDDLNTFRTFIEFLKSIDCQ